MAATEFLKIFLTQLLTASPYLIVLAAAFVFSLIKFRECPRAYLLAAIGTFVMFVSRIVEILIYQWLPYLVTQGNMAHTDLGRIYVVIGVVMTIITAVAMACVLVAVFIGRAKNPAASANVPPLR